MSGYPSGNYGAGVEFAIVLSGTGITGESGEYFLKLAYQSTVTVTASVVDVYGTALGSQPALTAKSFNGPPSQSGEASEDTAFYPSNSAGQQYGRTPNQYNPTVGQDVTGIGQTSNICSVSSVVNGVATVTITGVGQGLVEWRSPRGTTARLQIQGIQQS